MTPQLVIDLFSEAIFLVIISAAILVLPGLSIGLVVSTFQAATQINEQTLSFLPRLLITLFALIMAGPYLLNKYIDFSYRLMSSIPSYIG